MLCVRSLFETVQTLYFAVYGLTSVDVFRINEGHHLTQFMGHHLTQFIGKLMFGCYCACMIIVLINMLIAMLSQAYETISVCSINLR